MTVVTTMVDRITPPATRADELAVLRATGRADRCPVTTEPFTEWALSGHFPGGRPRWQDAGAIFAADIVPFEKRKLWMLNASHSLLAYAGSILRHVTVAEAVADEVCLSWLDEWWTVAAAHLDQPAEELAGYRAALLGRFENAAMGDRLDRIAADGSQKLPVRVLPVLRAERQAGRAAGRRDQDTGGLVVPLARPGRGGQRCPRRRGCAARSRSVRGSGAASSRLAGP